MTETGDEMERLETKNFNCNLTSWDESSKLKEAVIFKDLHNRKLSQVVDTLQEFLCNELKKRESLPHNGCPESQEENSRQIRTIVLLQSFLKKACDEKDLDAVDLVWKHLMDYQALHETSEDLLYAAAERGSIGLCECLIEMGISVNGRNLNDYTPLMGASRSGHLDVVQVLCSNQGDASLKGRDGDTALHIASRLGHEKIVRFLAQQGANMEVVNKAGFTPMMEAVRAVTNMWFALLPGLAPLHRMEQNDLTHLFA